jgi:hypothetical protein
MCKGVVQIRKRFTYPFECKKLPTQVPSQRTNRRISRLMMLDSTISIVAFSVRSCTVGKNGEIHLIPGRRGLREERSTEESLSSLGNSRVPAGL